MPSAHAPGRCRRGTQSFHGSHPAQGGISPREMLSIAAIPQSPGSRQVPACVWAPVRPPVD